jgi:diaminohydroxyphosphoribosylaminopyrimidine deaminase/5-amino-6-(5-phosphoribosylamino)uracil reductase
VCAGVLAAEAEALNEEYLHRARTGRAFGVLKAAVTLDGRLGADGGDARWISGREARARSHELRDRYDGILVGRGTLERDDPRLDVRSVENGRDPVAVAVMSRLGRPSPRNLWQRSKNGAQVIVATSDAGSAENWDRWVELGVELLMVRPGVDGRPDPEALFRALAARGLNSVLVEGGERIHTACLQAGVIHRAHVFVAPMILGGREGPRLVGDLGLRRVADAFTLADPEIETLGRDLLVTGRVVAGEGKA